MRPLKIEHFYKERALTQRVRRELLRRDRTLVAKTHGSAWSAGWPDLYVFSPARGGQWVEVKTPRGRLTRAQRHRFAAWAAAGVPIWVVTSVADLDLLNGPHNVAEWL